MARVLGIGNALVDLLISLEDDRLLEELNLPKGSMTLVDEQTKDRIAEKSKHLKREMASGGSAANTIHGLARLGIETAFIGTIGRDETGEFFKNDLLKSHIRPILNQSETPSGLATTLISPDGERTFGTYLGASIELSPDDFDREKFSGFDLLHVEGYLVQNHELLETILKLAKQAGLQVSIDMASYNVVEENLDYLKEMVERYVDIVFANEEEARAFSGLDADPALDYLSGFTEVAIVKTGSRGSMVKSRGKVMIIDAIRADVADTTGAGDLYAAGFLYGMVNNKDLKISGNIGSLLATQVVEVMGAKIPDGRWETILKEIKQL
ncbi:MAG TPA: adenosine kinase [Bacteroidetes bacterium]|nr:adenosine kinase [Bacteroidota bacterium]